MICVYEKMFPPKSLRALVDFATKMHLFMFIIWTLSKLQASEVHWVGKDLLFFNVCIFSNTVKGVQGDFW